MDEQAEQARYLQIFERDAAALAAAARMGMEAPVPSCPGWIVANLVIHLGTVYRGWVSVIEAHGAEWPLDIRRHALERTFPALIDLFEQGEKGVTAWTIPTGLLEWFEEGATEVVRSLGQADLDEPFWQPPGWPSSVPATIGLFQRAANIETAVHRWDAQLAHQCTAPIDRLVAEVGIEQVLQAGIAANRQYVREHRPVPPPPGHGETYLFQQTDGKNGWLVRFDGDEVTVEQQEGEAGVVVRGTASDLMLFLWHRIPPDRLHVTGDSSLLERYFELAPPV